MLEPSHPLHRRVTRPLVRVRSAVRFARYFAAAILDDLAELSRHTARKVRPK